MLKSEAITRVLLTQEGVTEVGFNNRGPKVEEYQRADDLPGIGYAWCVSVHQWAADQLGIVLPSGTASVGLLEQAYKKAGLMVEKPSRGCQGFWRLDGDGWPDHIFTVTKCTQIGPVLILRTIEGNTSPENAMGSQDDGGGVHQRTRVIRASRVTFGKLKGALPDARVAAVVASLAPRTPVRPSILPARKPIAALYWLWLQWTLGEDKFAAYPPFFKPVRPASLPRRIPDLWWERREDYIARRQLAA